MDNGNLIVGITVMVLIYLLVNAPDDQAQMTCTVVPITNGSTIYTCTKE